MPDTFDFLFEESEEDSIAKPGDFVCKGCACEVRAEYSLRTPGYCYLCDPAITIDELMSDEPIKKGAGK